MQKDKNDVVPQKQDTSSVSIDDAFTQQDQALAAHRQAAISLLALPPELQRAVQALCDTYETLDLRIETTLAAAENDFISALSEVRECEDELRQLVSLLISDLRNSAGVTDLKTILLRLSFRDEDDLAQQVLSIIHGTGDAP